MQNPARLARYREQFHEEGFCPIEAAFDCHAALHVRTRLWEQLETRGVLRDDPATWTEPVIRLGLFTERAFTAVANTPVLHQVFDEICGSGQWEPCNAMGTFPIRFPSESPAPDTGWHIDPGFGFDDPDFMNWRTNMYSRGRRLLMLFLFSDVDADDAPTKLLAGSHLRVSDILRPAGHGGLTLRELCPYFDAMTDLPQGMATGAAGTVFLCHPFLVHSAQRHRGKSPRFLAQPPLLPARGT